MNVRSFARVSTASTINATLFQVGSRERVQKLKGMKTRLLVGC